ncbi:hypothetical protein Agub_g11052, partial [Astrephomene gubernaculifera]
MLLESVGCRRHNLTPYASYALGTRHRTVHGVGCIVSLSPLVDASLLSLVVIHYIHVTFMQAASRFCANCKLGLSRTLSITEHHCTGYSVAKPLVPLKVTSARLRIHTTVRASAVTITAQGNCRAMPSETAPVTVISFDVDGTLIHSVGESANKLHKDAFSHGFKAVFGLDTNIDVIQHHGSTDPLIIIKVLEHHGISKEEAMSKLQAVQAEMERYFTAHRDQAAVGLELLPGVKELLARLQSVPRAATCLVTGNLEPIGWGKMERLGILELFSQPRFGGFGSDFCSGNTAETWRDRGEFVRIAARKCEERHGPVGARFHVGDTPMDIQAALDAGAVAIGVATGIYSR